mgnify:FL=1
MAIMKEGRVPAAQMVKDDAAQERALVRLSQIMNELLQRHDYPEDVVKIVQGAAQSWMKDWKAKNVGKGKDRFSEFMNSGLTGFGNSNGVALLKNKRRRSQAQITKSGRT